ncbi:MAG: hypothetical protein FRX49_09560 [Trebouxia sp. A1-2]|nr:MAG: hypothetical protein FRX49_09560 [Trebouxia sp. A1-2]
MGSAGTVRRFTDALQLFFQLSDVPKAKRVLHARLYLEGLAADCAGALPNAGAASHAAGSVVPKTASAGGQKQKKRKSNGLGNGAAKADTSGKVGKGQSQKKPRKASVHNDHMKEWLKETTAATIAANLGILPSTASQKL